jgi:hypothetical protein
MIAVRDCMAPIGTNLEHSLSIPYSAFAPPTSVTPKFATRQIMDDLYQIVYGGDMFCTYVLVGSQKALVVDTNAIPVFDGVKLIDRVRAITDKPLYVANTHSYIEGVA